MFHCDHEVGRISNSVLGISIKVFEFHHAVCPAGLCLFHFFFETDSDFEAMIETVVDRLFERAVFGICLKIDVTVHGIVTALDAKVNDRIARDTVVSVTRELCR